MKIKFYYAGHTLAQDQWRETLSKNRYDAQNDANQPGIIKELLKIPGMTVQTGHDDILVGYKGETYWYEIKASQCSPIKPSQYEIIKTYTGHYRFAFNYTDILVDIGIVNKPVRSTYLDAWHKAAQDGETPHAANKAGNEAVEWYIKVSEEDDEK
ncbi:MAG: hypothetical protein JKY53_00080 [Flavobacteriales bacterium]|nr:hypothetical protein [Flavobacteriales bacterium]